MSSTEARQLLEMAGPNTIHDNSYANACISKWQPLLESTGKNDPIQIPYVKKITAVLLENEMQHLKQLNEDTLSTNTGYFTKYTFPILRRVWPNLIANQIVSVQPMTSPVGGIFYYEKKYTDRKGSKIPYTGIDDLPTDMNYDGELAAGDNMMQNLGKYYSSEFIDYDCVCTNTGTSTATLNNTIANCRITDWSPIRANGTSGQRTFSVKFYYRIELGATDQEVIATMDDSGNLIDNTTSTNTVGTFDITDGTWTITPKNNAGSAVNFVDNTVVYAQYYINYELVYQTPGGKIPSVHLDISLVTVQAESRKLKARWTVEAVDDMRALHGMDVETEIVSTFSNEVMLEIDREIIDDLIAGAMHSGTYTYADTTPGEIEAIRRLLTSIGAISGRIHKASGRGPANFIVVGPSVASLLDQLSTHGDYASIEQGVVNPWYNDTMANYGISRVGTLLRKWAVYLNPWQDETKILVGFKGRGFIDAGYAYCPYVPLQVTPTFLDPDDQTFRKGIRTRFATKMLRSEYYGVITCSGLPTVS
jgi:hypothetical protein